MTGELTPGYDAALIKGLLLSLGCMAVYFSIPHLYYSRVLKALLYFGAFFGCALMLTRPAAFGAGLFWCAALLLFSYYACGSGWYLRSVLRLTWREWERQLPAVAPPRERQATLLRRVAESWNPRWSPRQLEWLTANAASLDDLIRNIQSGKWKALKDDRKA